MSALIILIAVSLFVATGFLVAFLWSVRSGQYDDDYTPSVRILFEDNPTPAKSAKEKIAIRSNKKSLLKNKQK